MKILILGRFAGGRTPGQSPKRTKLFTHIKLSQVSLLILIFTYRFLSRNAPRELLDCPKSFANLVAAGIVSGNPVVYPFTANPSQRYLHYFRFPFCFGYYDYRCCLHSTASLISSVTCTSWGADSAINVTGKCALIIGAVCCIMQDVDAFLGNLQCSFESMRHKPSLADIDTGAGWENLS